MKSCREPDYKRKRIPTHQKCRSKTVSFCLIIPAISMLWQKRHLTKIRWLEFKPYLSHLLAVWLKSSWAMVVFLSLKRIQWPGPALSVLHRVVRRIKWWGSVRKQHTQHVQWAVRKAQSPGADSVSLLNTVYFLLTFRNSLYII